jgi:CDP-diacylglycerol--glycerol-3-phosphate 3-phosphatidyltransferase
MAMSGRALQSLLSRITLARIALVPAVVALVLVGDRVSHAYVIAAVLFAIAAVTDFWDGYLARRWAMTTALGSFLDSTADKLLVCGALVALVAVGRASPWIAIVILGRELMILSLRGMVATRGTMMTPSIWGKLKANVQFAAILLAIVRYPYRVGPLHLDEWVMLTAGVITVMSGVEYLTRFSAVLSPAREHERSP